MTLIQHLTLLWQTFTPAEHSVLTAATNALRPEMATLLRAQIACVTSVQRILDWTEINFYARRRGRARWPESILFPNRSEFQLAAATYRIGTTRFRTTLIAINGHIFSFVTRPSIKGFSFGQVEDLVVTALDDPFQRGEGSTSVRRLLPPSYLSYRDLQPERRADGGWNVLAADEPYVVALTDGDFVVLAERGGQEWLLASTREGDMQIYHSTLNGELKPVADEFERALER